MDAIITKVSRMVLEEANLLSSPPVKLGKVIPLKRKAA
jgi:hypothetical protein